VDILTTVTVSVTQQQCLFAVKQLIGSAELPTNRQHPTGSCVGLMYALFEKTYATKQNRKKSRFWILKTKKKLKT